MEHATAAKRPSICGLALAAVLVLGGGCSSEQPAEETPDEPAAAEPATPVAAAPAPPEPPLSALEAGRAFLAENSVLPGVVTTPSGLQYKVMVEGEGDTPGPTSTVLTHYHGTFLDGRTFDSSVDRGTPAQFAVGRVIRGWTEALQMMKVGDKWTVYVPPELAYGERGMGPIGPNETLIFEVELLDIVAP